MENQTKKNTTHDDHDKCVRHIDYRSPRRSFPRFNHIFHYKAKYLLILCTENINPVQITHRKTKKITHESMRLQRKLL